MIIIHSQATYTQYLDIITRISVKGIAIEISLTCPHPEAEVRTARQNGVVGYIGIGREREGGLTVRRIYF